MKALSLSPLRRAGLLLAALALALPRPAAAQPAPGTCASGVAQADLDNGSVRARVYNNGNLFYGNNSGSGNAAQYVVPKETGASPIYAADFWVGGLAGGELRTTAATYYNFEFWPGPLDADGNPPADCTPYDRIYEITREDLARYACTGEATDNLRDWPWHLGAPVVDGDGIEGNYDLAAGDRPALLGDQMLWWVMNDAGNRHSYTGSPPIGLEVQVSAFAADPPPQAGPVRTLTAFTTFYRYRLVYKGSAPLTDAYVGLWMDPDFGDATDDFVGSDTTLDLAYVYNADNDDVVYGLNPPAAGVVVLKGPTGAAGQPLGMETFVNMTKWGTRDTHGEPVTAVQVYRTLRGRWSGGAPITEGGFGYLSSTDTTLFHYPGDPAAGQFWSEVNIDGSGTANTPGDRRFSLSSGPFTMQPGDVQTLDFAIAYAQGPDHLRSVSMLKNTAGVLRSFASSLYTPDLRVPDAGQCGVVPIIQPALRFVRNHPDPVHAGDRTTFDYSLPETAHVRFSLYDVLGREVAVLAEGEHAAGVYHVPYDVRGLSPGVYFARFVATGMTGTGPLVVTDPVVVVP